MKENLQDRRLQVLAWSLHAIGFISVSVLFLTSLKLAVTPVQGRRQQVVAEMMETSKLAKGSVQIKTDHAKAKETLQQAELRTLHVSRRIPKQLGEKQFLHDIIAMAKREGLVIRDIVPGMVNHESRYAEMPLRISAVGTYRHLCGLLEELSQLPRLVTVSDLVVTSSTDSNRHEWDITVRIYFESKNDIAMKDGEARHG